MTAARRGRGLLGALATDRAGATAVIFAVIFPLLAVLACGAVDLSNLYGDRSRMQDVADSTALMAAKQIGTATAVGISARAQQYAQSQLADIAGQVSLQVSATLGGQNNSQVTVAITGHRPSFFANLLPPGGWTINVQSTASAMGEVPLCVLATAGVNTQGMQVNTTSQVTANGCMVQSNANVQVAGGAQMNAGVVQATGTANGPISPTPQTGAASIPDPFASLAITIPQPTCSPYNYTYIATGVNVLAPGEHCGNFTVTNGATLQLLPGEHYFVNGNLTMQGTAVLTGVDVVLIFDKTSHFNFQQQALINLVGRKTGPYAGFVIATTRNNTTNFNITSTAAEELLGTVYIPAAQLHLNGTANKVAQLSAWTVVVANSIVTDGGAQLVINSDYAATDVPVPSGVGPTTVGQVILTH